MVSSPQYRGRRSRAALRRRRWVLGISYAVGVLAIAVIGTLVWTSVSAVEGDTTPSPTDAAPPASTPTEEPPALTAAEQLLVDSGDDTSCAVTFEVEGATQDPMLQTQGILYDHLPVPTKDGAVFAGWYATPEDAAGRTIPGRVNGSKLVECTDQEVTLYGSWVTPEENVAEDAQIPILMYHQFSINPDGEPGWLHLNYIYTEDFDQQMKYIADGGFYLPTWQELSAFIDGKLYLPTHSVIITDDDADWTWFDLGAPIIDKYELLTTSFMVTAWRQDLIPNEWTLRRSHSHDMHRAGSDGEGRIVTMPHDEIVADLNQSAEILDGVKEVFAYPFGDYNDAAKQAVADAGFEMARTIEQGYVHIGSDKLALPCIRINYGMGVGALANLIG